MKWVAFAVAVLFFAPVGWRVGGPWGLAAALNLQVIRSIFVSWVVTLPAGGMLAALFYFALKGIFTNL